ncbi:hypothetical protein GPECTOR_24g192 [Gonium pectorale]|uniref:Acyl-CoA dehydrogenase/oxidase C-terminal domain-containing protein n=1 Tax=Gonium pectorale TaxID=33097 RepID=A0A150GGJ6_GONPE|nr:hypothetical protein GPECTOR_24g192 [Gonium pectorale]|eukprot:KXZ48903.1 hypothetical protein GPECTOR_24g192 [Gonium pectorale]
MAGAAPSDSSPAVARGLVVRSKSFHQAFLDAKAGLAPAAAVDDAGSLEVAFPLLVRQALQRAFPTRPAAADSGTRDQAQKQDQEQDAAPAGGSPGGAGSATASGSKGRFMGAASRLRLAAAQAAGAADQARADTGPVARSGGAAGAGRRQGQREEEDPGEEEEGADGPEPDPASLEMVRQMRAVYDSGCALDGGDGGGKGDGDGGGDPQSALIKDALRDKLGGDDKDAIKDGMKNLLAKHAPDLGPSGGGGGGGGGDAASDGGAGGGKPAGRLFSVIQAAANDKVSGKEPWLPHGLSPRQAELRAEALALALRHVLPHSQRWHERRALPRSFLTAAARSGMCGMLAPLLAGGRGWSHADAAAAVEPVGGADLNVAAALAWQNAVTALVGRFAPLALRLPLTAALSSGACVGTLAASEPTAPWGRPERTASFGVQYKDTSGDYWVLSGLKDEVPLGGAADLVLLAARTSPDKAADSLSLFLLPKGYPGAFWLGAPPDTLGARSHTRRGLLLAGCLVRDEMRMAAGAVLPALQLAGEYTRGLQCEFRLLLASSAVGAAASALTLAQGWLADPARRHFSQPLIGYQGLQHRLAKLAGRVEAARLLVQSAAAALDAHDPSGFAHVAMAKRRAIAAALEALDDVRPLFGAASSHAAYPLERVRRDLLAYRLLGGDDQDCGQLVWSRVISRRKAAEAATEDGDGGEGGGLGD